MPKLGEQNGNKGYDRGVEERAGSERSGGRDWNLMEGGSAEGREREPESRGRLGNERWGAGVRKGVSSWQGRGTYSIRSCERSRPA